MRDPPDYGRQQLRSPGASSARQAPARRASPSCDILHIRYGLRRPDHRIMKDAERRECAPLSRAFASLAAAQTRLQSRWPGHQGRIFIHCRSYRERTHLPSTGSSGLPWWRHPRLPCLLHGAPSPLAAKLVAVTAQGVSGDPGRNAGQVHEDPGRSRGRGMDVTPGSSSGGPDPGTSRWSSPARSRSPGTGGCGCPARPHLCPAVTLSDMGGQGERSPSRRSVRRGR
jgi:hypothetical protein